MPLESVRQWATTQHALSFDLKHQIKKHVRDSLIVEEDIPHVTLTMTHPKQRGTGIKEKEKRAGRINMWCLIVVCGTVAISLNTMELITWRR